ncbi:hypothetical protein [Allomuricauda sp. M10]|uniref:hypothetical protein n=1 Tax=Allomuricauda sp. M10 TaxID=2683292 RepID=UPI001D1887F3|nr:hypothetical protein [Muricauda sp. M10]
MKTSVLKFAFIMLIAFASCSTDNNDEGTTDNLTASQITELNGIALSGDWVITYFFDTDKEETSNFNGYTFTFNADGTLVASNGTTDVNGTWSITDSNSSDDDSNKDSDVDFNILFTSPNNFEDLSDDWDIVSFTSTRIELIDVSGGNGGTDKLVFEIN